MARALPDFVDPIPPAKVRRQVAAAIEELLGLEVGPRAGGHVQPRWQSTLAPKWWLVLDVGQDGGVARVRVSAEEWPRGWSRDEPTLVSRDFGLSWSTACEIGRSSVNTRHLRIFKSRVHWALEADKSAVFLAEQHPVDAYLEHALPTLLQDFRRWMERRSPAR